MLYYLFQWLDKYDFPLSLIHISALRKYATYNHPKYGTIYAFEVDGFGNHLLMDDANAVSYTHLCICIEIGGIVRLGFHCLVAHLFRLVQVAALHGKIICVVIQGTDV